MHCPCERQFLREAFVYDAPPPGETRIDLGRQDYRRACDRCTLCGHWFGRHDMDLCELYANVYVDATYSGSEGMIRRLHTIPALPLERSDNVGRVTRIQAFARSHFPPEHASRRLLDVGAGIGVFPAAMKAVGWKVTAIEPDWRTAKHLRREVGIEAWSDNLLTLTTDRIGYFDSVSFNKVLEHVENPMSLLVHARLLLASGGFCYVELPDVAAAQEGPEREEFFIEHHHVFSPGSLIVLSERSGFSTMSLERLREPSGKFTLRAFMRPTSVGIR